MELPFSINASAIANTIKETTSNVTNYAASSVMDYLNNSTEHLRDNNNTKVSVESFNTVNITTQITQTSSTESGLWEAFPYITVAVIVAVWGFCIWGHNKVEKIHGRQEQISYMPMSNSEKTAHNQASIV